MSTLALVAATSVFLAAIWIVRGWESSVVGSIMLTTCLMPVTIARFLPADTSYVVGYGGPNLSVYSYWIPVGLLWAYYALHPIKQQLRSLTPFVVYLLPMFVLVWPHSTSAIGGLAHLAFGYGGYYVGWRAGLAAHRTPESLQTIARWILVFGLIESGVFILQALGSPIFPPDPLSLEFESGRASGTFGHPGTYGKVAILLCAILLCCHRDSSGRNKHLPVVAFVSLLPGFILSESRSNFAALLLMVAVWTLVSSTGGSLARRLAFLGLLSGACLLTATIWIDRFATGEDGQNRIEMLTSAVDQILRSPWRGVGPNQYVIFMQNFDDLAAQGWPVHNVFALLAVELGVVGMVLYLAPIARCSFLAWQRRKCADPELQQRAWAILALLPGFLIIASTGWGLLGETLVLVMLCFGFLEGSLLAASSEDLVAPQFRASQRGKYRTSESERDKETCRNR